MPSHYALCPLPDLAVLQLTGADAAAFLHAQISQDVLHLSANKAALGAYCTAKGRTLATLIFWSVPDQEPCLQVLVKKDLSQALLQRLRMFVLRSKVKLDILDTMVYGAKSTDTSASPEDQQAYTITEKEGQRWIRCPDSQEPRWWLISPSALEADPALHPAWLQADIRSGLPWVELASQELYIPQTLNLDLIAGINFRKGCYPGQEVVARSHYRGTIKRRMAYAISSALDNQQLQQQWVNTDVFLSSEPDRAAGRIINAAILDMQLHVLMEVQLQDIDQGDFYAGSTQGPQLRIAPLPYSLLAE